MKRFIFRLARVLQLRVAAEREQARQLALVIREEEVRRVAYQESAWRLEEAIAQLRGTPRELSTAGTLRNLELTVLALAAERDARGGAHQEALSRVEAERQRFDQARIARLAIERLRERRWEAWGEEAAREEQREHDEAAVRRTGAGGPEVR